MLFSLCHNLVMILNVTHISSCLLTIMISKLKAGRCIPEVISLTTKGRKCQQAPGKCMACQARYCSFLSNRMIIKNVVENRCVLEQTCNCCELMFVSNTVC